MRTVTNPPTLVPQETGAWCFAAAEQMVRAYLGLEVRTQYEIARAFTAARAVVDPTLQEPWQMAVAMDESSNPPQAENGGANDSSQVVQLVRAQWGVFDQDATDGTFIDALDEVTVREEIDHDRIVVVGNPIHYFVVFGYEGTGVGFELLVLDPWPAGQGGQRDSVKLSEYLRWEGRLAIRFG
jgi:hypothetical protein